MQIVLKIPKEKAEGLIRQLKLDRNFRECEIVELPKGHGDLIDRKDLIENGLQRGLCDWYDEIKMADTIIEAEGEA